jgi:hypothetical protein
MLVHIYELYAIPKKMLYGTQYATRRRERPRMRWLDDVSMDLRKMGVSRWRDRARNQEAWMHIVEEAKAHPGLSSCLEGYTSYKGLKQDVRNNQYLNSLTPSTLRSKCYWYIVVAVLVRTCGTSTASFNNQNHKDNVQ